MNRQPISRRETAVVAIALLLPIPLLAASGLNVPLPTTVERSLASLLPGGSGESAGETGANLVGAVPSGSGQTSGSVVVSTPPSGVSGISDQAAVGVATDDAPSPEAAAPDSGGGGTDEADTPTGGDDTPPTGGDTDGPGPTGGAPDVGDGDGPLVNVSADDQGASAEVSTGEGPVEAGVSIDADVSAAGGATASVEVTSVGGITSGVVTPPPLTVSVP